MNGKINEDIKSLKFILDKNKPFIVPLAIILICIILFAQFVVPQFGALLKASQEGKEAKLRLETLRGNLNILRNINSATLDSQVKILNLALPLAKDFSGILNSIQYVSEKTEAILGNFSFKVGDLSKSEESSGFPMIKVSIPINSSVTTVNNFVKTINETVPLSEASLIKIGNVSSVVDLHFYYKPLGVADYSQDAHISPISQKGLILINNLSGFGNTSSFTESPIATSSSQ